MNSFSKIASAGCLLLFSTLLTECDMWVQYHHVPVDGLPMLEIMHALKEEFGTRGKTVYPTLSELTTKPEIFYFGNKLFRARIFIDFSNFLLCRKYLNNKYLNEMHGPCTIASMIIWGLAQHNYFRNLKFLFPVDTKAIDDLPHERSLGILAIRPAKFMNLENPIKGFINFQHEFNKKLLSTRLKQSETYELMELITILHPSINYLFNKIFPKTIGEVMGTVGVTILKDAEMFVTPATDIQKHGFIAIGKMYNQTLDNREVGAINICGTRKQVKEYFTALHNLTHNLLKSLNISY